MGTIVVFEQDPIRSRMRKKPKATAGFGIILPFSGEQKNTPESRELICVRDEKLATGESA